MQVELKPGDPFDERDGAAFSPSDSGVQLYESARHGLADAAASKTSLTAPGGSVTANTSAASLVDPLLLRRSAKAIPPIQVPPIASASGLRSPAMRSSTLTDSFPLPPPRTPLTPSTSHLLDSPKVHLSVPPPSPFASKRSTASTGYWDADLSSLREQAAHPGGLVTNASSPVGTPGATQAYMPRQSSGDRIRSYIAELSNPSPLDSPFSERLTYPPQAYSPELESGRSPKGSFGQPIPLPSDRDYKRDSGGTFASALSSMHSMGVSGAINTLEHEGFDFQSDRSPSLSGHTHAFSDAASITSSVGNTHHLVRYGNVLEARRANGGSIDASRRLARASLVSSQLLRSASSSDALKDVLRSSPGPDHSLRADAAVSMADTGRPCLSTRYSSGPAPSLASLAEDDAYDGLMAEDEGVFVSPKRPASRPRSSRHSSGWTSKTPYSHKSRRSTNTHFTIASEVPSLPSIGNHAKRAELAARDSRMSTRKMAKRASRLSQLLEEKPGQSRNPHAYPTSLREGHVSLNELRFGSSKPGKGIPGIWASNHSGIIGKQSTDYSTAGATDRQHGSYSESSGSIDESHFRRRRSYPVNELGTPTPRSGPGPSPLAEKGERSSFSSGGSAGRSKRGLLASMNSTKKRRLLALLLVLIVLIIVMGIVGGVVLGKKSSASDSSSQSMACLNGGSRSCQGEACSCRCSGQYMGTFCQLDATCQCPDGSDSCDTPLARSIMSAASYANTLFSPLINTTRLASSMQSYAQTRSDCSKQAQLLDLPNMDASRYKSRQKWAQAVLLWDMASSEDFDSTSARDFQNRLDYWRWQDQASFDAQSAYQTQAHGYTIDFAFQKVFAPQRKISDAAVSTAQLERLESNSTSALERVLAYATASSTQRSSALSKLFAELGYSADQLAAFRRGIQSAPAVFAFDAAGQTAGRSTMEVAVSAQSAGQTFPRPLTCTQGFEGATLDAVNRVQNGIFGLPTLTSGNPANCTDSPRPLYGYLNVLNLRTPASAGTSGQAVVINNADVKRRLTFRAGRSLDIASGTTAVQNATRVTADTFGTYDQLDAVILNYLNQLASVDVAKSFVDYLLSSPTAPPDAASPLLSSLSTFPTLEVQLWGRLPFSDIDYIVSDVAIDGQEPIFARSAGNALRSWAHASSGPKPIRWAGSPESATYASDAGGSSQFQSVWDGAASSSEQGILNALQGAGLMTQQT